MKGEQMSAVRDTRRNDILQQYGGLVHRIAWNMARRMPQHVEFEDLKSAGVLGLLDAADRFDATVGGSFATYAELRIRGAIMDELRALDWVPRSVREKESKLARAEKSVRRRLGRPGTDPELSAELGISEAELRRLRAQAHVSPLIRAGSAGQGGDLLDQLPGRQGTDPETRAARQSERRLVWACLSRLDERARTVLQKSYFEGVRLKEIGRQMGLTESRISQIRSQALRQLQPMVRQMATHHA
jgi:RNA polymerase sigma factor for flagellar operon FliA